MPISYKKLFHLLLDRDMKKGELQEKAGITASIMARLAKDETVKSDTIGKICKALECQPGDIMEYIPDEEDMKFWDRYKGMMKGIEEADTTQDALEVSKKTIQKLWEDKKK